MSLQNCNSTSRKLFIALLIISVIVLAFIGIVFLLPLIGNIFKLFSLTIRKPEPQNIYEIVLNSANFSVVYISVLFTIMSVAVAVISIWGSRQIDRLETCQKDYAEDLKKMGQFEEKISKKFALDGQLTIAKIFFTQKDYSKAWEAIKDLPNELSYEVPYFKAKILINKEKGGDTYIRVIELLNKALESSNLTVEGKAMVHSFIGRTWLEAGDYRRALIFSNRAIQVQYTSWSAHNQKAICWRHLKRLDKAIEILENIIRIDETYSYAYYNLACYYCLYMAQDKTCKQKVIQNLKKAAELRPEFKQSAIKDPDFDDIKDDPDFKDILK